MANNSLKMITIDRNMSVSWKIVSKKCNRNISAFVDFIVWNDL